MAKQEKVSGRRRRFMDRMYAKLARRQKAMQGFVSSPEPRTIGSFARGRQLIAGNLLFAGYLVESQESGLWEVNAPTSAFDDERHGFAWLDDLAAVGDLNARALAQRWLWGWIAEYDRGSGPGWSSDLTGRRLIRWINHALFLLRGQPPEASEAFFTSLSRQVWYLSKRWRSAAPGLPRFEALTGLIYAGLALEGREGLADPAVRALSQECERQIDDEGGLPTRNPEELLEVFTLLVWASAAMQEAGRGTPLAHAAAIERIAPTLRALRHADGSLARFHGGGRGLDGRLDHALSASGIKPGLPRGLAMGFARIQARRTSLIVDASPPPKDAASYNAHASTMAFELSSGRRPLIVNCGSGVRFGQEWRRAGRATPSHSAMCLSGYSSARLGETESGTGREPLLDAAKHVPVELSEIVDGTRFQGGHDGYVPVFGLTVARTLELNHDGRGLAGEDMLLAMDESSRARFRRALASATQKGLTYDIRFHLHPDVDAEVDMGGTAISMALKSGEIWVFRHDGLAQMSIAPSVYLETGRLKPRATQQIVLSGRATQQATRIRWTLAKAQDTAVAVRDLARDEPELTD